MINGHRRPKRCAVAHTAFQSNLPSPFCNLMTVIANDKRLIALPFGWMMPPTKMKRGNGDG
jgi:hypothetical protein